MITFKDKLLALVDTTANQARSLIGDFSAMVNDIDWDSHFDYASDLMRERKESLTAKANSLMKEFSDLVKQVKDSLTDFSVMVAFDEAVGEKLDYSIVKNEDGGSSLVVEVSFKDDTTVRSNKTTVKIPQNCDLSKIGKKINKVAKTATITIPKMIKENVEEKTASEKPKYKVRKTARKKSSESASTLAHEETSEHISTKLAEKLKQNVEKAKMRRDANGRFTRREAPKE